MGFLINKPPTNLIEASKDPALLEPDTVEDLREQLPELPLGKRLAAAGKLRTHERAQWRLVTLASMPTARTTIPLTATGFYGPGGGYSVYPGIHHRMCGAPLIGCVAYGHTPQVDMAPCWACH